MYNSMILEENFGNWIPPRYYICMYIFPNTVYVLDLNYSDTMEPGGFICIRLNPFHNDAY